MLKKSALGNIATQSLEVAYKCGECLHHKSHAHPSFKEVCIKRGIRAFAVAPKCFTPDVTQIANNSDSFVQLAALHSSYSAKERRILIALLRQRPIKNRQFSKDLAFGTKIYFLAMGADYISNYLSGYVMGTTSSGELIITGSPERNTRGRSYMAYMSDADNILTAKEWKAKATQLKASGRINDPKSVIIPKGTPMPSEPITIDSAPAAWHDKEDRRQKKRRRTDDLVITIS